MFRKVLARRVHRGPAWAFWRRGPRVWQVVVAGVGVVLSLQALIVGALSVVALRRQRRAPVHGFPHRRPAGVTVGENQLQAYSFGHDLYSAMLEAIDSAHDSIYIESFIWKGDVVGRRFKEHLAKKADEGVKVYVIFDRFGNLVVPRAFKRFPPPIHATAFQSMNKPWHLLDPRRYSVDHRKLLIVDGQIGFIGGYNIGSLYATQWRDTHLRIEGPAALDLAQSFVDFWNRVAPRHERIARYYPRRFIPTIALHGNDSLRLTFPIRDMYIDAFDRAQRRILLTTAYFIPDHILLDALKEAAQRGVEVHILLPWTSNHIVADWISRAYFTECLRAGIHIWGYRDVMIHAKTCTVDGEWSTVGTANLDRLSAVGNYEINVEIYSSDFAREMEQVFASDLTNAHEITAERWLGRPFYVKVSERILAPLGIAM